MVDWNEKVVQLTHLEAYGYFTKKEAIAPRKYSDYLPGSEI